MAVSIWVPREIKPIKPKCRLSREITVLLSFFKRLVISLNCLLPLVDLLLQISAGFSSSRTGNLELNARSLRGIDVLTPYMEIKFRFCFGNMNLYWA